MLKLSFFRSSLSVGFNSTSVVILEDFVKGCFKMKINDRCSTIFVKILIVLFGLLALCLLFLIEKLGGVLAVSAQILCCYSIAINLKTSKCYHNFYYRDLGDGQFGRYRCRNLLWCFHSGNLVSVDKFQGMKPKIWSTLGRLNYFSNKLHCFVCICFVQGAFVGAIAGFTMSGWVSFGANAAIGSGLVVPKKLPPVPCLGNVSQDFLKQFEWPKWVAFILVKALNLSGIARAVLTNINSRMLYSEDDVFPLYRLSYHWVAPIGTLVVLVVGGIVTWMTGARDPSSIDRNLLSPVIHR